jgi:hypothetical protein
VAAAETLIPSISIMTFLRNFSGQIRLPVAARESPSRVRQTTVCRAM